jgi:hypothetical protein
MPIHRASFVALLMLASGNLAFAQSCIKNTFGQILCAPPNGSAQLNAFGQVVCGPGECVVNSLGQILCSSRPGGGAIINQFGQAACVGGCVQASPSFCRVPR